MPLQFACVGGLPGRRAMRRASVRRIILIGGRQSCAGNGGRESNMRNDRKPYPRRGLLAGAVGGLIACFAMSQFHSFFQNVESSDEDKQEDSTVKTASAV